MLVYCILAAILGAAAALAVSILIRRSALKGKKEEILEQARLEAEKIKLDAENIKKDKILQAKERFLQLKSEHDQYVG